MERWSGKVAVITGASAGIGAAIAAKLVENGLQVVGLARRLPKLELLAAQLRDLPGKFHPLRADVTLEEDVVRAVAWAKEHLGGVHILVNNAGIAKPATLLDGDTELFRQILETNVLALTVATREAVKVMRENGDDGHVVHINSGAGHRVPNIPFMNVYPATKYAVTALAQTLRLDLMRAGSKIRVTSLSPGLVETEIIDNFMENEVMAKVIEEAPRLVPEDVANAVVFVLGAPAHVQVSELTLQHTGSV